ncbi:hypothetical protein OXIME_001203 [Oxyplasma meridianum]|uniref:Uncharacterized protein n=1 Tax=Oxyplasma meridianum TaxID=3073602 RepID=A0AAX4NGT5_9ARCH
MKGSPFRKRYVLVYSNSMEDIIQQLERDLFAVFHAKKKYIGGQYAIFLTDQFKKKRFIEYVNSYGHGAVTLITSGTILKCKKFMASHSEVSEEQNH